MALEVAGAAVPDHGVQALGGDLRDPVGGQVGLVAAERLEHFVAQSRLLEVVHGVEQFGRQDRGVLGGAVRLAQHGAGEGAVPQYVPGQFVPGHQPRLFTGVGVHPGHGAAAAQLVEFGGEPVAPGAEGVAREGLLVGCLAGRGRLRWCGHGG